MDRQPPKISTRSGCAWSLVKLNRRSFALPAHEQIEVIPLDSGDEESLELLLFPEEGQRPAQRGATFSNVDTLSQLIMVSHSSLDYILNQAQSQLLKPTQTTALTPAEQWLSFVNGRDLLLLFKVLRGGQVIGILKILKARELNRQLLGNLTESEAQSTLVIGINEIGPAWEIAQAAKFRQHVMSYLLKFVGASAVIEGIGSEDKALQEVMVSIEAVGFQPATLALAQSGTNFFIRRK